MSLPVELFSVHPGVATMGWEGFYKIQDVIEASLR